jgi:hypothetical protein
MNKYIINIIYQYIYYPIPFQNILLYKTSFIYKDLTLWTYSDKSVKIYPNNLNFIYHHKYKFKIRNNNKYKTWIIND